MRQFVDDRNRGNVHRVSSVSLKCPNTAFAQDDFVISSRKQVLRREEQFFQGRSYAALQEHRLPNLAEFAQQIEVLHVARTDLEEVNVGHHDRNLRNLHDFADHQQIEAVAGFAQQFQSVEA